MENKELSWREPVGVVQHGESIPNDLLVFDYPETPETPQIAPSAYKLGQNPEPIGVYLNIRGHHFIVDREDEVLVMSRGWSVAEPTPGYFYASNFWLNKRTHLHRMLAGATAGQMVDHRNGDTLDCRRSNLRICTRAENNRNRRPNRNNPLGLKGVVRRSGPRPFVAQINIDRKRIQLGRFATPEEAARAYDQAALRHFGEFARVNGGGR